MTKMIELRGGCDVVRIGGQVTKVHILVYSDRSGGPIRFCHRRDSRGYATRAVSPIVAVDLVCPKCLKNYRAYCREHGYEQPKEFETGGAA